MAVMRGCYDPTRPPLGELAARIAYPPLRRSLPDSA